MDTTTGTKASGAMTPSFNNSDAAHTAFHYSMLAAEQAYAIAAYDDPRAALDALTIAEDAAYDLLSATEV